ncbi:MAG TPA: response regulator transcription factor [Novosphingobium sp.]|nr:response regulator transcription factor [Novosphingobium sp.]
MARILVVEDDPAMAGRIQTRLEAEGYETCHAASGGEGLVHVQDGRFDAITLDRMLPDMDGLELLGRLRAQSVATPVLLISSLGDVDERIAGLRAGGDDYITKPFSADEMAMRVEVLLRRGQPSAAEPATYVNGDLRMDFIARKVWLAGEPVQLLQKEFLLLQFFVRHPGQTITRRMIFEQVWGYRFDPSDNLINVHVSKLRRKLERPDHPSPIATVKGEGYRFDPV